MNKNKYVHTPRGEFRIDEMTREQAEQIGYSYYFTAPNDKYIIVGNGQRAFAIVNE
ncbi:MAG: hypothetical protein RSA79_00035 [Oscillospiraceae bacterium]